MPTAMLPITRRVMVRCKGAVGTAPCGWVGWMDGETWTYIDPYEVVRRAVRGSQVCPGCGKWARVEKVLEVKEGSARDPEVRERLEIEATERQVRDDLATLRTLGLAVPSGRGRGARWKRL